MVKSLDEDGNKFGLIRNNYFSFNPNLSPSSSKY